MKPRNPAAFEQGLAIRDEIRALLLERPQTESPLTAKAMRRLLSRDLSIRQIQAHMSHIRVQADKQRKAHSMLPKPEIRRSSSAHPAVVDRLEGFRDPSSSERGRWAPDGREPEFI